MAEDNQDIEPSSGSSKKKTSIMLVVMLLLEAVVIIGAFTLMGPPAKVSAMDGIEDIEAAEDEKLIELLVLDDRLPNNKSGVTYLFDTEIYVQVKRRYESRVNAEFDQFENEIRAEINAVWKTSEPQHFQEPLLETLTRKIYAMLSERFGADQETGDRIISKCVIVMGTGMRIDS